MDLIDRPGELLQRVGVDGAERESQLVMVDRRVLGAGRRGRERARRRTRRRGRRRVGGRARRHARARRRR